MLLEAVTRLFNEPGKFPGCSGTRNLHDNLSDLRAQVAANQKVVLYIICSLNKKLLSGNCLSTNKACVVNAI